jgi:glycyl-tRNA synthetase beta subunit
MHPPSGKLQARYSSLTVFVSLPLILVAKRVNNIITGQPPATVNSGLFLEKEERELYAVFSIIKQNVTPIITDFAAVDRNAYSASAAEKEFLTLLVRTYESFCI